MCYCYVRMSERDITTLNARLLRAVERKSRDKVESLLDRGAEVNASYLLFSVCY